MSDDNDHKMVEDREFEFCPWCTAKLAQRHIDGKTRKYCPECDFVYYRNPVPAAGALIINDSIVLLVMRKYPPRVGDWSFPAGFMEYGESPAHCCIREVKEETGLEVKLTDSFKVYSGSDDPRTKAVLIMYIAEITGGDLRAGDDASELEFFPLDGLPKNLAFESHIRALNEFIEYQNTGRLPDPNE
jgi:ADP-ribose pyrophosphatase YjhB (NUDIX family)